MVWLHLHSTLVLLVMCQPGGNFGMDMEDRDWEWGSGLHELQHIFLAESPFVTEMPGPVVNCTQRFWLPPSSPVCFEDLAGPEDFKETRLLVIQNQQALHTVMESSGVDEGGASFEQQIMADVQGVREDHLSVSLTVDSIQNVFLDIEEKRKKERVQHSYTSLKAQIARTTDSITGREQTATHLEWRFSNLEKTLEAIQHRVTRLLTH